MPEVIFRENKQHEWQTSEYGYLVELIKHQHFRVCDFIRTFLTANTIITGACAVIISKSDLEGGVFYLLLLCIIGLILNIFWSCIMQRIAYDSELRFYQARYIEKAYGWPNKLFTNGKKFFSGQYCLEDNTDEEPLCFKSFLGMAKVRVVHSGYVFPFSFIVLYFTLFIAYLLVNKIGSC